MSEYDLSNLQILVVEDYAPLRKILRSVLRELGITDVKEATDGVDALETLETSDPDIIIVDHHMTPVGGIELTRMIRGGQSDVDPFVPIIMTSARAGMADIAAARDAGINEFLAKPISAKLVYYRVRSIVAWPRPYIRAGAFFGPDRRRRAIAFGGVERRVVPHTYAAVLRAKPRS